MKQSGAVKWGLAVFLAGLLAWWLATTHSPPEAPSRPKISARPLASYRAEFRRADGSLPDDAALAQILQAKGIPYTEAELCPAGQTCGNARSVPPVALPEIEFSAANLNPEQKRQMREGLLAVLPTQLEEARRLSPEIRLDRIVVDTGLKLQLHFNREFTSVADDESKLNDFSEGLHSLGASGLRGTTIYIAGQPLGAYLKERDAVRDREARLSSPAPATDGRR